MSGLTQEAAAAASVTARVQRRLAPTVYVSNGCGDTVTPIAVATSTVEDVPLIPEATPNHYLLPVARAELDNSQGEY
jgi:hypothetical protein